MQGQQIFDCDFFDGTTMVMQFFQVGFLYDMGRELAELFKRQLYIVGE